MVSALPTIEFVGDGVLDVPVQAPPIFRFIILYNPFIVNVDIV